MTGGVLIVAGLVWYFVADSGSDDTALLDGDGPATTVRIGPGAVRVDF